MRSLCAYWKPKSQTRAPDRRNKMTLDQRPYWSWTWIEPNLLGQVQESPRAREHGRCKTGMGTKNRIRKNGSRTWLFTGLDWIRRYGAASRAYVRYHSSRRRRTSSDLPCRWKWRVWICHGNVQSNRLCYERTIESPICEACMAIMRALRTRRVFVEFDLFAMRINY